MRYKIKVNWAEDLQSRYHTIERLIDESDFDSNIKVLNLMLKSCEITSYEIKMEGH